MCLILFYLCVRMICQYAGVIDDLVMLNCTLKLFVLEGNTIHNLAKFWLKNNEHWFC